MIEVRSHTLQNGLRLLHHRDATTQMVALNLLYNVGSRDEEVGRTGFAHLFEHLMFGGSAHIPDFDEPLQSAGGESNAWTSDDITNFYDIVPAHNVETAFWLESDRLRQLAFSQHSLDAQKSVVIEEFKQRCLNVPYGDVDHILRRNAYSHHPYSWPVIGSDVKEIEIVNLDVVRDFYYSHYAPNNLIMCVAGNISFERAVELAEKWMGDIPRRAISVRSIGKEPKQTEQRQINIKKDVPQNLIVKAYHMCGRLDADYHASDLISDILANGNSARFFQNILMKSDVFTDVDASIWGSIDPGLMMVRGRLQAGATWEDANGVIEAELSHLINDGVSQYEIDKYINKLESKECFENISYTEKASKLCYFELLSKAEDINTETEKYRKISRDDIQRVAQEIFVPTNETRLYYGPEA